MVPYLSFLNAYTGSPTASILLMRCLYWMEKKDAPFYKFLKPCEHPFYREGDSFVEELGFSTGVLDGAMKKICTKIKFGHRYLLLECGYLLKYSNSYNQTFFVVNYPKLAQIDFSQKYLDKYFKHFGKWKLQNPNVEKWNSEVQIFDFRTTNFGIPIIQCNTQRTTQCKNQGEVTLLKNENLIKKHIGEKEKSSAQKEKVNLPFNSERFENVWKAWKGYRLEAHGFHYSMKSEIAALFPISNYHEAYAIELLRRAIDGKWKGFHFTETPQDYQRWYKLHESSKNNLVNLKDNIYDHFK